MLPNGMFASPLRRSWLLPVSIALALLTSGIGTYAAWRYSWQPERDDAWKTWSVGYGQLGVAFDPTGTLVASGGWDYAVTIWDVRSGDQLQKLRGHQDRIYEVAFTPDGQRIASGSKDSTTRFWSLTDGKQLAVLRGHSDRVMALAISSDGRALVTGSRDSSLKLWDTAGYTEVKHIQPRSGFVAAVAFDPRGNAVLFGDWTGHVRFWRTDVDEIETLDAADQRIRAVAFSSEGSLMASASRAPGDSWGRKPGTILVFDAVTRQKRATLRAHSGGAYAVAFSPDARTLATGGADGTIVIWDTATFLDRQRLLGHAGEVFSLAFSPDGHLLASASGDGCVRLWRVE
jgi:WD40 repeat protein